VFQIQDDLMDALAPGNDAGSDIREGNLTVLAVHCLNAARPEETRWLWGVLRQPPDRTSPAEIEAAVALYHRVGSIEFAFKELERCRAAALSVAALAEYPTLVGILADACDLFVRPLRALQGNTPPADATGRGPLAASCS
jgi:geranylgeranyl pyrophosphate synthase